jgi:hypothetical protein
MNDDLKVKIMKYLMFLFTVLLLSSCGENKHPLITLKTHYCEADTVIDQFSDSSFVGRISCLQYYNNKIYALDFQQKYISVFSENLDTVFLTGRPGHGPGEFSSLYEPIYVYNDTLHVFDGRGIQRFYKGKYTDAVVSPIARERGRFAYISGTYYLPYPTLASTFVTANANTLASEFIYENLSYAGTPVKYRDDIRTIHNNHRSLLIDSGYIYLISFNLPVIEKYDLKTLDLLQSFDLSNISEIRQNIKYAESMSLSSNSVYSYIRDGYISDNILYLLFALQTAENKNTGNAAVLRISLYPEMKVLDMLKFEGQLLNLCVTPEHIFMFDMHKYAIMRYKKIPL